MRREKVLEITSKDRDCTAVVGDPAVVFFGRGMIFPGGLDPSVLIVTTGIEQIKTAEELISKNTLLLADSKAASTNKKYTPRFLNDPRRSGPRR